MENPDNLIFSLDIGTRKVAGIVARKIENKIEIVDLEMLEHKSRTMLDGQIHNINEVAKIVKQIKNNLEQRLNITLRQAGVAVAGRALKTVRAKTERDLPFNEEITYNDVRNLELQALSGILHDLNNDFGRGDYYCVGYSVINYHLDGEKIGDLLGHFGRKMSVDVIATFLPRVVLDSMMSVLRRAELEAISLTLEPIAAINVIIPADVRRLNLALVDIGAGTSDVALTKDGAVFAYGMVPEAGDEITEIICEKFILDFTTAESIKRKLLTQKTVTFNDILGKTYQLETEKIIELIKPRVNSLAKAICSCIQELNQNIPNAVILVGGGSLTPLINAELARSFPIEENKIGIRLPDMVSGIEDKSGKLKGPEMVTPLGICVVTAYSSGLKFVELFVNGKHVHVLDMQQSMDVLSALVAAGIDKMKLYGKIGQALCVEVNGELKIIKGKMGVPARVKLNGQEVEFTAKVKNNDKITFESAKDGEDANALVGDVIEGIEIQASFNGQQLKIKPPIFMNGAAINLQEKLTDRAKFEYSHYIGVKDLLSVMNIDMRQLQEREIVIRVNKEPKILSQKNFLLSINGKEANLNSLVYDNDVIEFDSDRTAFIRIRDVVDLPTPTKDITVMLNGEAKVIKGAPGKIFMNGQLVNPDEFLIDRAEIVTQRGSNLSPTVSQVLENFSFNPEEQRGKLLKITVNGKTAGFTTQLFPGANVTVNFVEI